MSTIFEIKPGEAAGAKYKRIASAIAERVERGDLSPGERLPAVREVAWRLEVTPGTVARAYSLLVDQGVLVATVGRGTFVADRRKASGPASPSTSVGRPAAASAPQPTAWPELVDLRSPNLPDVGQSRAVRDAMRAAADDPEASYEAYPGQSSDLKARVAAAEWMASKLIGPFTADDVVLANGGQNAILVALQAILRGPAPVILAEDLSYAGFRRAARLLRAEIIGLPSDQAGVRPDALLQACKAGDVQVFCTSPDTHNPTVHRTGLERRRELAAAAESAGLQILEDDCYTLDGGDLPGYRALAPDHGWYVSSLSKELTPSLRFGYLVPPKSWLAPAKRVAGQSFFGLATPVTETVARFLPDAAARRLPARMREEIGALVQIAVNVLGSFELSWRAGVPFLWLALPQGWRASTFCRAAEREGVLVRSADDFILLDGSAPNAVRIAINGRIDPKCFEAALTRLARLLSAPPQDIEV